MSEPIHQKQPSPEIEREQDEAAKDFLKQAGLTGMFGPEELGTENAIRAALAKAPQPAPRPALRQTHTVVTLDLSNASYDEIRSRLIDAGYEHCFTHQDHPGEMIDLTGIAIVRKEQS